MKHNLRNTLVAIGLAVCSLIGVFHEEAGQICRATVTAGASVYDVVDAATSRADAGRP